MSNNEWMSNKIPFSKSELLQFAKVAITSIKFIEILTFLAFFAGLIGVK